MSVPIVIVVGAVSFAVFASALFTIAIIETIRCSSESRRINRENAEAQLRYEIESEICRRHKLAPPFPPCRLTRW